MDKFDLVEAVNKRGLIEVFTRPSFDPTAVAGCSAGDRFLLRDIKDELRYAVRSWNYFLVDADVEHREDDCD